MKARSVIAASLTALAVAAGTVATGGIAEAAAVPGVSQPHVVAAAKEVPTLYIWDGVLYPNYSEAELDASTAAALLTEEGAFIYSETVQTAIVGGVYYYRGVVYYFN